MTASSARTPSMFSNYQIPPWMQSQWGGQPSSYETDFGGPQMGGQMQMPPLSGNTPPQQWGMQTGGNTPPMQMPQMNTGGNQPPMQAFQPQGFGQASAGRARAEGLGGLGRWFQGGRRSAY